MVDKLEGHRDPKVSADQYGGKPRDQSEQKRHRAVIHFDDGTVVELEVERMQMGPHMEQVTLAPGIREALGTHQDLTITGKVTRIRITQPFYQKS